MYSLQSLNRDTHQLIALQLAQEPSKATAYVPSVRAWGTTNSYYRTLLLEAGWLAPADVCKAKLSQAVMFTCPALRVLDVAEHFAPELPLPALSAVLATLPKTDPSPDPSALPMMLVGRAASRLHPETKAGLEDAAANSPYALPVGENGRGWTFSKAESKALKRFVADCFGVASGGDFNVVLAIGHRHFSEDFMEVVLNLPVGLKALAFHELTYCLEELTVVQVDGTADARMDILFEVEQLIPVQWHPALSDLSIFAHRPFDRCVLMLLSNFGPRVAADAGKRVVALLSDFFRGSPKSSRHWSTLDSVCSADEIRLLKGLVRLMHDNPQIPSMLDDYLKSAVRSGFILESELASKEGIKKFQTWCLSASSRENRMLTFTREIAHRAAYS